MFGVLYENYRSGGYVIDCNFVGNAAQFIKHFGKYGEIIDSVIMKDRKTGQPRGFGFVTYSDPSVVDKVIQDTHIINGKQVGLLFFFFFPSSLLIFSVYSFCL